MKNESLLEVEDLSVRYRVRGSLPPRWTHAVSHATLTVGPGETVGLVGESGSGKTTLARAVVGLVRVSEGSVRLRGIEMRGAAAREWQTARRVVQMVLQDPYGSLNPHMSARELVVEAWRTHRHLVDSRSWNVEATKLLERVGIRADQIEQRPRQFSGGQRQRIGIARALAVQPELLVCDEPTSALDVSVQAQVLNLIKDIQVERHLGVLFISHDLGVVRQIADRVAVMYRGEIVESGPVDEVFDVPQHPYTQRLLSAIPDLEQALAENRPI